MEMYAFLLRPGLAALDNLADKFVAGWLLSSKVLDLSYPTPPLPLLVFAIQSDEGRQLAGRSTASRSFYRGHFLFPFLRFPFLEFPISIISQRIPEDLA